MTFKNTISFLVFVLFLQTYSFAQTDWQWGKRGGSNGGGMGSGDYELVEDMATDIHGNVYVLANNNLNIADIDGHPGISHHDKATISSFDCNGNFRWMKTWGSSTGAIGCKALKTDSLGGVYIAASVSSHNTGANSYLDTDSTLERTYQTMSLVKYDTAGNFQWLRQPELPSLPLSLAAHSGFIDMDVAPNGDCYLLSYLIAGSYADETVTIDKDSIYVVKYDRDGNWVSATPVNITVSYGIDGRAELVNLGRSHFAREQISGRYYLCGTYDVGYGDMSFGETALTGAGGVLGGSNIYLGAFDSTGKALWTVQALPDKYGDVPCRPAFDRKGNIYFGGSTITGNQFAGHLFENERGMHQFPFVLALDKSGSLIWASNAATNASSRGFAVAVNDDVVVFNAFYNGELSWDNYELPNTDGSSGKDLIMTKFNSVTGRLLSLDLTQNGSPSAIAVTSNGQVYIGGAFDDELIAGDDVLEKLGGSHDWFVAKHGSSDCNCTLAVPDFSVAAAGFNTLSFSYTGTTPVDSVVWETGDGSLATGLTTTHTYAATGSYTICATAYNDCGISVECRTYNSDGTTSLENIAKQHKYTIYPNPASSSLFIKGFAPNTTLEIFNTIGKRELAIILKDELSEVNVSGLAAGIYLMRFTDKNGTQAAHRFVKQ